MPPPMKPEGYENHLTVSEMAKFLGLSERTIEHWYAKGKLPKPAKLGERGTKLWSPDQRNEALNVRIRSLPSVRAAKRRITKPRRK